MKTKEVGLHTTNCDTCFEMARRGYRDEGKYWCDRKEKPVKYILMYKGKKVKRPILVLE